jgi:hypothetical protein
MTDPGNAKQGNIGGSPSPTSVRRAQAAERQRQAVTLRLSGQTFQAIAEALGYANRSAAYKAVAVALDRWGSQDVAELQALEAARLDSYLAALAPQIERGSVQAIAGAVAISARRSKLLGLDAPTHLTITEEMLEAEHARLKGEVAALMLQQERDQLVGEVERLRLVRGGEG